MEIGELSSHLSPTSQSDLEKGPTLITTQNCKMLHVFFQRSTSRLICLDYKFHRPRPSKHCRAKWKVTDEMQVDLCSLFHYCPEQMSDIISSLILVLSGPSLHLRSMNPVTLVSADCLLPLSAHISVKMMVFENLIREHPTPLVWWISKYQRPRSLTR